jgi:hypothetical protein
MEFLSKEQMKRRVWDILELCDFNEKTEAKLADYIDLVSGEPIDEDLSKGQAVGRILDIYECSKPKPEPEAVKKLRAFLGHLRG